VLAVHRGALEAAGSGGTGRITTAGDARVPAATVGDRLLTKPTDGRPVRRLECKSHFARRAAGRAVQPIAANVDTLLVVSSCDRDFNVARLERYLALAREARVAPVVVLTKADLCAAPEAGGFYAKCDGGG
jgi:ribosome biogenesis GTPase / thiamine phosphate phosphatase